MKRKSNDNQKLKTKKRKDNMNVTNRIKTLPRNIQNVIGKTAIRHALKRNKMKSEYNTLNRMYKEYQYAEGIQSQERQNIAWRELKKDSNFVNMGKRIKNNTNMSMKDMNNIIRNINNRTRVFFFSNLSF